MIQVSLFVPASALQLSNSNCLSPAKAANERDSNGHFMNWECASVPPPPNTYFTPFLLCRALLEKNKFIPSCIAKEPLNTVSAEKEETIALIN